MDLRLVALFSVLGISALGLSTTARAADCNTLPLGTNLPCDGCTYESGFSTRRDESCSASLQTAAGAFKGSTLAYLDSRIIVRAKHGIAGTSGNGIAYSPNKGYIGQDDFVVEKAFQLNGRTGRYKIHYHVDVQ